VDPRDKPGDDAVIDEDTLAFLRTESEFRNLTLVELPNGDFGRTVLRNFLFAAFQVELWPALTRSLDRELAAIAAKALQEARYHLRHAADWTVRLGDGSAESKQRMQRALDELWPYTTELFTPSPTDDEVARLGLGAAWASLQEGWRRRVHPVLAQATLAVPAATAFVSHGKFGRHSEHLGRLLAEMQVLQRTYPGCRW
jgi:ring-1,2-phenylacetyl-CoA epoxidase subunit PaaC